MPLDFDEHLYHRRIMQEAFTALGWPATSNASTGGDGRRGRLADRRFAVPVSPGDQGTHPSTSRRWYSWGHGGRHRSRPGDHGEMPSRNHPGRRGVHPHPVPPFKWWRGLRARKVLGTTYKRAGNDTEGHRHALGAVPYRDEDGNRFTDEDIVNHMIMLLAAARHLVDGDHGDGLQPGCPPGMAGTLPRQSARLGDGPLDIESLEKLETLDLVMNESLRLVTPLPFNMRRTVRDTDLLGHFVPAGTLVWVWRSMNHRLPEFWDRPGQVRPERSLPNRGPSSTHRYAFARLAAGVQAHRPGVRPAGDQGHHAPAAAPVPARTGPDPAIGRWDYSGLPVLGWTECRSCCDLALHGSKRRPIPAPVGVAGGPVVPKDHHDGTVSAMDREAAAVEYVSWPPRPAMSTTSGRHRDRFSTKSMLVKRATRRCTLLDAAVRRAALRLALELGTHCGYSALRIAGRPRRHGVFGRTGEANAVNARQIWAHAESPTGSPAWSARWATAGYTLIVRWPTGTASLEGLLDFLFIDHDKATPISPIWVNGFSTATGCIRARSWWPTNVRVPGAP